MSEIFGNSLGSQQGAHGDGRKEQLDVADRPWFNTVVVLLIILNAVLVGVEADQLQDSVAFFALDFIFALAFLAEMLIRQFQLGLDFFLDAWNLLDYAIVVLNWTDLLRSVSQGTSLGGVRLAATIRIFRLMRVVEYIRAVPTFFGLWVILQGLLDSLITMAWVSVLLVMIAFCMATALTSLVGFNGFVKEHWIHAAQYTGSVYKSWWTVFQVLTFDDWTTDIVRPFAGGRPWAVFMLLVTIVVCNFGLLNLIVSVMIERTVYIAQKNRDLKAKLLDSAKEDLREKFEYELKSTGLTNFKVLLRTPPFAKKLNMLGIQLDQAENLYDILDVDKSGEVTPSEFRTGLQKLKDSANGQDIIQLISVAQRQCELVQKYVERVRRLNQRATLVKLRLDSMGQGASEEIRLRKEAAEREEQVWKLAEQRQHVIDKLDFQRQINFPSVGGRRRG